jgi:hypothetical protein
MFRLAEPTEGRVARNAGGAAGERRSLLLDVWLIAHLNTWRTWQLWATAAFSAGYGRRLGICPLTEPALDAEWHGDAGSTTTRTIHGTPTPGREPHFLSLTLSDIGTGGPQLGRPACPAPFPALAVEMERIGCERGKHGLVIVKCSAGRGRATPSGRTSPRSGGTTHPFNVREEGSI